MFLFRFEKCDKLCEVCWLVGFYSFRATTLIELKIVLENVVSHTAA